MKRIAIGVTLIVSILAWRAPTLRAGKWVKLVRSPSPRKSSTARPPAASSTSRRAGAGWKPKALAYEFDPAATRDKKKPMALLRHHVASPELGGKLYAFGASCRPASGPPAWVPVDNAWEYDPATDTWKARWRRCHPARLAGGGDRSTTRST